VRPDDPFSQWSAVDAKNLFLTGSPKSLADTPCLPPSPSLEKGHLFLLPLPLHFSGFFWFERSCFPSSRKTGAFPCGWETPPSGSEHHFLNCALNFPRAERVPRFPPRPPLFFFPPRCLARRFLMAAAAYWFLSLPSPFFSCRNAIGPFDILVVRKRYAPRQGPRCSPFCRPFLSAGCASCTSWHRGFLKGRIVLSCIEPRGFCAVFFFPC